MQTIKKILSVIDPTVENQPAMHRAAWLAKRADAELELLVCYYNEYLSGDRLFDSPSLEKARSEVIANQERHLEELVPRLERLEFHRVLGSLGAKAERVGELAAIVAAAVDGRLGRDPLVRVARLVKADLLTHMVGEFPELQGVMGGHYLRLAGEPEAVWTAARDHYRPQGFEGDLPASLEGLLVGANPAAGVFLKGDFLHPELDFALSFPSTWETDNQPEFVIAMPPEGRGKTAVVLGLIGEGEDPVEGARSEKLDERLLGELELIEINGLRAARVVTEKRGTGFDLTWIAHGGHVYRIASVSPTSEFSQHRDIFRDVAQSFRPLRSTDRARIRASRLRVRPGREGESLVAFLQRTRGTWSPAEVAIANGFQGDARLGRGQLLKVPISERYTPRRR